MTYRLARLRRWGRKLEIVVCLAVARLMIKFLPYRFLRRSLGPVGKPDAALQHGDLNLYQSEQIRLIGRHILQIANRVPFKAVCLPQAMAGRWMLSRRNIKSQIFIGVRKGRNEKPVDLHAWLMVNDKCVTGDHERLEFAAFEQNQSD